ncbi:carboxymethylenebutenolidase homolog isoform X2 [Ptychodera flava]|uniref:carboxymethylenebutenolidase homolog isoform X2 n=1 Tax=Ptychodera flava TaxID=63121 RepID=UPI00396A201D
MKTCVLITAGILVAVGCLSAIIALYVTQWREDSPSQTNEDTVMVDEVCDPGDTRDDYEAIGTVVSVNSDLSAYVVQPSESCKAAVVVVHDAFGFELGANRAVADDLARHGYTAILPDLFRGNPYSNRSVAFPVWLAGHPQSRIDGDLDSVLAYIRNDLGLQNVGIVGFCWGGGQVALASAPSRSRFQAGVAFYGVLISQQVALAMRAPTLLIFAQNDTVIPVASVHDTEEILQAGNRLLPDMNADESDLNGSPAFVKIFENVGHAFAHRGDRNNTAVQTTAEQAFSDMYTWLGRFLPNEVDES